jgi:hypothetical protein
VDLTYADVYLLGGMTFTDVLLLVFLVFSWGCLMAKLSDVQASLDTLTAAVTALAARIPPKPAATEADLDGIKTQIDATTAAVQALAPTV